MTKNKKQLKDDLDAINGKIDTVISDIDNIKKQLKEVDGSVLTKQDKKKMDDIRNKISSL